MEVISFEERPIVLEWLKENSRAEEFIVGGMINHVYCYQDKIDSF